MARQSFKIVAAERRKRPQTKRRLVRQWQFIDPFPGIHGTLPEKMVYAELTRLGIPFYFLNDIRFQFPDIEFDKEFQADFVIPSIKLIIEVQGAHWHSMAKTIEADAYKFAIYETGGYKVLAWWDYDIISRLHDLVFAEPLLLSIASPALRSRSTELVPMKRTKVDTSKGIRTLNARRRREKAPTIGRRSIRKAKSSYTR